MPADSSRAGLKILVIVLVVAAAAAGWWYFGRPVAHVVTIARGTVANVMPGTVVVEPEKVGPITCEIDGKLKSVELAPGTVVHEGDVVAELDTTDVELEIQHARNEYEAAKKNAAIGAELRKLNWQTVEENFEAAKRDFEKTKLSKFEMDRQQRAFDVAKQQREAAEVAGAQTLETLQHTLALAERRKEKMTVRAPFEGVITEVFVNKNSLVTAKQPLGTIVALTRIVKARISEENFPPIAVGQKATVSFLGYGAWEFDAVVMQKLPTAEPGTQRYSIYLKVDIPAEKLLPNLTGEAAVYVDRHENVVTVPRRAISDGQVLVVEGGRVRSRPVEIGYADLVIAEVKKGLEPGEQVIVDEREKFSEGDRVRAEPAK
jgi:RND family efflux transporter MFP subunit